MQWSTRKQSKLNMHSFPAKYRIKIRTEYFVLYHEFKPLIIFLYHSLLSYCSYLPLITSLHIIQIKDNRITVYEKIWKVIIIYFFSMQGFRDDLIFGVWIVITKTNKKFWFIHFRIGIFTILKPYFAFPKTP